MFPVCCTADRTHNKLLFGGVQGNAAHTQLANRRQGFWKPFVGQGGSQFPPSFCCCCSCAPCCCCRCCCPCNSFCARWPPLVTPTYTTTCTYGRHQQTGRVAGRHGEG